MRRQGRALRYIWPSAGEPRRRKTKGDARCPCALGAGRKKARVNKIGSFPRSSPDAVCEDPVGPSVFDPVHTRISTATTHNKFFYAVAQAYKVPCRNTLPSRVWLSVWLVRHVHARRTNQSKVSNKRVHIAPNRVHSLTSAGPTGGGQRTRRHPHPPASLPAPQTA